MVRVRTCTEANVPRRMAWRVMIPNQVSIWFSQLDAVRDEVEVHVRMTVQPGPDVGDAVGGQVVQHHMDLTAGVRSDAFFRKARNAGPLRRGTQSPITSPVLTLRAANRLVAP
jgi:hypothetical protein